MKNRTKNVFAGVRQRQIGPFKALVSQDILENHADFISAKYSTNINALKLPSNVRSTFLVSFSYDSALVASTHGNHRIYIWRVPSGECVQTLVGHPRTPWTITFHPSSIEILASGCLAGEVRVWDLQGSSEVWRSPNNTTITSLSFHPKDRVLAIATGNQIFLWDWREPLPFTSVQTNSTFETVRLVRFDSLGHYLLTGIANLLPEHDQQDASNSDENPQDSSNQGSEDSDPEPLEPDTYPPPSLPEPSLPEILQMQPSQGDIPMPRPISPESMETLEQARDYAASVTLNALRSRHQRGFSLPPTNTAPQGISNQQNYSMGPGSSYGFLMRSYNAQSQEGSSQSGGSRDVSSIEGSRHSVESLSNLANFASTSAIDSLSQMSQNLGDEFVMPRPGAINADSTSPVNEQSQHIRIPSDDSDTTPSQAGESMSGQDGPIMVEVEGEQIQVAVVTDSRAATRFQPRAESAYVGRIPHAPTRRHRTAQHASSASTPHYMAGSNHAQSVRGRSTPRYQAQVSRRSLPGHVTLTNRRFMQGVAPNQPLSREGEEEGQAGEGLRRRRPSRFGFHRTALRRRVLHSHYSSSLFDNNQPPLPSVHYAINRAIANALAGRGQMAVANNVSNRTHRLQWWDFSDYVLPDISDSQSNVIVSECKIHNDASVDVSRDRRLAAFIPSHMGFPDHGVLAVCSLEQHNLGEVLYTKSFGPNAITVSLSPTGNYILVGLAARRLHWQMFHGLMADVYQLQKPGAGEDSMTFVNRIIHPLDHQQRLVVSVNIARWIPRPGAGLIYGTNRGDLCICLPKLDNEDEPMPCEVSSTFENRIADSESNTRHLDMVERRRSYSELGVMAVRLSNSQSSGTSQDTSTQAGAGPQRRAQSTQTRGNVVQNMATQTDFNNDGHAAGRQRVAERRSDVNVAIRSGTLMGMNSGDGNNDETLQARRTIFARNSDGVEMPDSGSDAVGVPSHGTRHENRNNDSSSSSGRGQDYPEQRLGRSRDAQSGSLWQHIVGPSGDASIMPRPNIDIDNGAPDDGSDVSRRVNSSFQTVERDGNNASSSSAQGQQGSETSMTNTSTPVASYVAGPSSDATSTMRSTDRDSPPHNGAVQSSTRNGLSSHAVGPGGDAGSTMGATLSTEESSQSTFVAESTLPTSTNQNTLSYGQRRWPLDQVGVGDARRDANLPGFSGAAEMDRLRDLTEVSRTISSSSDVDRQERNARREPTSGNGSTHGHRYGIRNRRLTNMCSGSEDHTQVASSSGTGVDAHRHVQTLHSTHVDVLDTRTSNASRSVDPSLDPCMGSPGRESVSSDGALLAHRHGISTHRTARTHSYSNQIWHQPAVGSSDISEGGSRPFSTEHDDGLVDTSSDAVPCEPVGDPVGDPATIDMDSSSESISLVTSSDGDVSRGRTRSRTNQIVTREGSMQSTDDNDAGPVLVDSSASSVSRNSASPALARAVSGVDRHTRTVDSGMCGAHSSRRVDSRVGSRAVSGATNEASHLQNWGDCPCGNESDIEENQSQGEGDLDVGSKSEDIR